MGKFFFVFFLFVTLCMGYYSCRLRGVMTGRLNVGDPRLTVSAVFWRVLLS